MVEFRDRRHIERWLKDKPRYWSVLLAARAALRELPRLFTTLHMDAEKRRRTIILPYCRVTAIASFAGTWPKQATEVVAAVRVAAFPGVAAADAAALAADALAADATEAAVYASLAAYDVAAAAAAAFEYDASMLETGETVASLAALPLWPDGKLPADVKRDWKRLDDHLREATTGWAIFRERSEGWQVWIDWYQRRLDGVPMVEAVERCYIDNDPDFWNRPPAKINADIAARLAALPDDDAADDLDAQLAATDLTADTDFAYRAEADAMVPVPFAGDLAPLDDPYRMRDRADTLSTVAALARDLAYDIGEDRPQVPATLKRDLGRYAREAKKAPEAVNPRRLMTLATAFDAGLRDEDIRHGLGNYLLVKLEELQQQHATVMTGFFAALLDRAAFIEERAQAATGDPEQVEAQVAEAIDLIERDDWAAMPAPPEEYPALLLDRLGALRDERVRLDFVATAEVRAAGARRLASDRLVFASTVARLINRTLEAAGNGHRLTGAANIATLSGVALGVVGVLLRLLGLL